MDDTIIHLKSPKLKIYPGENVTDLFHTILVGAERLDIDGAFNTENLGYITRIFDDTSESIFRLWFIKKYKEVTEFIKKLCVFELYFIQSDDFITYYSLIQEATHEHHNLIYSKRWEPASGT